MFCAPPPRSRPTFIMEPREWPLCTDPGTAKKIFEKQKRGEGLAGGERDWEKIPGFHLGGSPLDSSREKVKDRIVAFSTPTPLKIVKNAKHVVMGSFVNLDDVYDSCLRGKRDVVVVCAAARKIPLSPGCWWIFCRIP